MLIAAFPPFDCGVVALFALTPLLVAIPRLSERAVEWLGFLTGFAFYAVGFRWFAAVFGFPAIALWGLLALFLAVFCVLVRSLPEKMAVRWRLMLIPCFWVAVEYIRCEQWPLRFSWLALGYSQVNAHPLMQVAGLVGVYGLSFLIVLAASCSAELFRAKAWWGLAFPAVLASVLWLEYHVAVDSEAKPTANTGRIVLVQSRSHSIATLERLSEQAMTGPPMPTMVVWPEYTLQWTPEESPDTYASIRKWAAARHVTLAYGGITGRGGQKYSSAAFVVGPDGADLGHYEKHNPLPFFQDGEPGAAYPTFNWRVGSRDIPFGVTICFDLSFERNARIPARNGAHMLVVPSLEPSEWPRIEQDEHAMVAAMRAVENGVGVVRCSSPGPSQIVPPNGFGGRALAAGTEGTLVWVPRPGSGRRTPYNRFGWLFPYACQAVSLGWIGLCIRRTIRARRLTRRVAVVADDGPTG
jgi:apolipoprotein N-acyltransferase